MSNKRKVGELFDVKITIHLWLLIALGIIILMMLYSFATPYRDHIIFAAAILGGAAGIYSAYYIGISLRLNLEREKKNKSFELLGLLNRQETVDVRQFIEDKVKQVPAKNVYGLIMENKDLLTSVTVVLGIFEDISMAIQAGFVDENIMYQSLHFMIDHYFSKLQPYIARCRDEDKNHTIYIETEKLALSWKIKERLYDKQPLPKL